MSNDFINKLRQMVDDEAADIIKDIEFWDFDLQENPNDLTIYSFERINDDVNLTINIMVFTPEQDKESNNIFYDSSSFSLMKKDYYIMDKEIQRIRVTYDGFININPAHGILELQDIDKYITNLVSEIVRCAIYYLDK